MKYNLIILPESEMDIQEAFEWYEAHQQYLGRYFVEELDSVFQRIEECPLAFQKIYGELRRAFPHRFPYAVYFLIDENNIIIKGILHQRKNPQEWQSRYVT
ncbi:type II toxin-antitoxin system RelE/ParE family toxin [Deltaproteobacteria bacterium TL4]